MLTSTKSGYRSTRDLRVSSALWYVAGFDMWTSVSASSAAAPAPFSEYHKVQRLGTAVAGSSARDWRRRISCSTRCRLVEDLRAGRGAEGVWDIRALREFMVEASGGSGGEQEREDFEGRGRGTWGKDDGGRKERERGRRDASMDASIAALIILWGMSLEMTRYLFLVCWNLFFTDPDSFLERSLWVAEGFGGRLLDELIAQC